MFALPIGPRPKSSFVAALLLRLGLTLGPAYLLRVPRRTGERSRSTLILLREVAGRRYALAGAAHPEWIADARAAGWGFLGRGRREERVTIVEVAPEARSPLLDTLLPQPDVPRPPRSPSPSAAPPSSPVFRIDGPRPYPWFDLPQRAARAAPALPSAPASGKT